MSLSKALSASSLLRIFAAAQYRSGPRIARNDLQRGDVIFWAGLGHVGIYLGGAA